MPDPAALYSRRVRRPWRVVFVLYALAMVVGIHWPRLHMGVGDAPAPDKIIHFFAFGGLTFLLWMTGWVRSLVAVWLAMMVCTYGLEWTQSMPILGRTFTWLDVVAGWLGVTSVAVLLWSLQPIGGAYSRLLQRQKTFVMQHLFANWSSWSAVLITGGAVAGAFAICAVTLFRALVPLDNTFVLLVAMLATVLGGVLGCLGVADRRVRTAQRGLLDVKPCFECGASCASATMNEDGYGTCTSCGGRIHTGQWAMRMNLPRWMKLQAAVPAAILLLIACAPVAITIVPGFFDVGPASIDFQAAILIAVLIGGFAAAVRTYRDGLTNAIDAQARTCRACGHDVHATPSEQGIGRCSECGTPFVRL